MSARILKSSVSRQYGGVFAAYIRSDALCDGSEERAGQYGLACRVHGKCECAASRRHEAIFSGLRVRRRSAFCHGALHGRKYCFGEGGGCGVAHALADDWRSTRGGRSASCSRFARGILAVRCSLRVWTGRRSFSERWLSDGASSWSMGMRWIRVYLANMYMYYDR